MQPIETPKHHLYDFNTLLSTGSNNNHHPLQTKKYNKDHANLNLKSKVDYNYTLHTENESVSPVGLKIGNDAVVMSNTNFKSITKNNLNKDINNKQHSQQQLKKQVLIKTTLLSPKPNQIINNTPSMHSSSSNKPSKHNHINDIDNEINIKKSTIGSSNNGPIKNKSTSLGHIYTFTKAWNSSNIGGTLLAEDGNGNDDIMAKLMMIKNDKNIMHYSHMMKNSIEGVNKTGILKKDNHHKQQQQYSPHKRNSVIHHHVENTKKNRGNNQSKSQDKLIGQETINNHMHDHHKGTKSHSIEKKSPLQFENMTQSGAGRGSGGGNNHKKDDEPLKPFSNIKNPQGFFGNISPINSGSEQTISSGVVAVKSNKKNAIKHDPTQIQRNSEPNLKTMTKSVKILKSPNNGGEPIIESTAGRGGGDTQNIKQILLKHSGQGKAQTPNNMQLLGNEEMQKEKTFRSSSALAGDINTVGLLSQHQNNPQHYHAREGSGVRFSPNSMQIKDTLGKPQKTNTKDNKNGVKKRQKKINESAKNPHAQSNPTQKSLKSEESPDFEGLKGLYKNKGFIHVNPDVHPFNDAGAVKKAIHANSTNSPLGSLNSALSSVNPNVGSANPRFDFKNLHLDSINPHFDLKNSHSNSVNPNSDFPKHHSGPVNLNFGSTKPHSDPFHPHFDFTTHQNLNSYGLDQITIRNPKLELFLTDEGPNILKWQDKDLLESACQSSKSHTQYKMMNGSASTRSIMMNENQYYYYDLTKTEEDMIMGTTSANSGLKKKSKTPTQLVATYHKNSIPEEDFERKHMDHQVNMELGKDKKAAGGGSQAEDLMEKLFKSQGFNEVKTNLNAKFLALRKQLKKVKDEILIHHDSDKNLNPPRAKSTSDGSSNNATPLTKVPRNTKNLEEIYDFMKINHHQQRQTKGGEGGRVSSGYDYIFGKEDKELKRILDKTRKTLEIYKLKEYKWKSEKLILIKEIQYLKGQLNDKA